MAPNSYDDAVTLLRELRALTLEKGYPTHGVGARVDDFLAGNHGPEGEAFRELLEEAATFIQDNVGKQDAYIDYEGKTELLRRVANALDGTTATGERQA